MVSNHIVMPIALQFLSRTQEVSGDVRSLLLVSRRISIAAVVGLGFVYFKVSGGSDALAAIGLIAFAGVAQFMPSLLGGIFWRGATRSGALAGLVAGFVLWAYTLFLPSLGGDFPFSAQVLANGPYGIEMLRPRALFGLEGLDPLVHALIWSLGTNALLFLCVSVMSRAEPLERLQATLFVDVFRRSAGEPLRFAPGSATSEDLFVLAQRILGARPARDLFDEMAREQGRPDSLPTPSDAVIARLERELAGSIGAASAHAMVSRIAGRETVSMSELIEIADETHRLIETSRALSEKSAELERAAGQLREANERLRVLDAQKDEFLSQVSHELRTPMTSVRSFSEILLGDAEVSVSERQRFVSIIHDESLRLTRLLDEILDASRLEGGNVDLPVGPVEAQSVVTAVLDTVSGDLRTQAVALQWEPLSVPVYVNANEDRMRQALINLLSNAMKYNDAREPVIRVRVTPGDLWCDIDVIDNGGGIDRGEAGTVFDKFNRGVRSDRSSGSGLGLTISRAIMRNMGGDLTVEFARDGTSFFRMRLAVVDARSESEQRAP